ncbi:BTAD domain-containing putative transcriptional regulator [Streptomyces sp. GD-15H]|uniref:AfsR/SARP family transcriptional regulator n=1 Tax=Streptomyces sp. GD-15H TaxID=3129112 RepID=UPI00324F2914
MYRVLGPVECFRGGRAVALGGVRQRRVLAALLMDADHVVSTTRLIGATWQQPPPTAQSQIQMVISRLRRALGVGPGDHVISTEPSGYRLQAGPGQLDSAVFQEHVAAAQDLARSSLDEAVARLRDGLAMWRGSALAGLEGSTVLDSWAGSLEEARLAAHELCLRLELQRGRHTETVGELMEATEAHPLREGLQGLLMQALYLSERQAEALAVYRQTRRRLIEELGVEPGARLRRLQYEILSGDTRNWLPVSTAPPVRIRHAQLPAAASVCTLPERDTDCVGRAELLERIRRQLTAAGRTADGDVPVVVLHGRGGSGKSTLAVHAAHELAGEFPDGRLYVDMQGRSLRPLTTSETLSRLLSDLGVDAADLPQGLQARAELFRKLVGRRRVLVVVDNMSADVPPSEWLPEKGSCAVLLTGRRRWPGGPGVRGLEVGSLGSEAAVELLGRIVGPSRVAAEWRTAHLIAQLCDRLPLALCIVGARLATRSGWTLEEMMHRLGDESQRLAELVHGGTAVRTVLAEAYQDLSPGARRLLRRLAAIGMPPFAGWAAPVLLGCGAGEAASTLGELLDTHLIEVVSGADADSHCYRIPDLVRVFACERAASEEPEEEIARVRHELLEVFLGLMVRAHRADYGGDHALVHGRAALRREPPVIPALLQREPLRWMDGERANLVWALREAALAGADEVCWDLAVTAVTLFENRCYHEEWLITHTEALTAVRRVGNRRGEAVLLASLGALNIRQYNFAEAGSLLERALAGFDSIGEKQGRVLALRHVAYLHRMRGDSAAALSTYQEALAGCRDFGDRAAETLVLIGMARLALAEGRLRDASALLDGALAICVEIGARRCLSQVLECRGMVLLRLKKYERAERTLERALEIVRLRGDLEGEARVAYGMGVMRLSQGRLTEAAGLLHTGTALAQSVGDQALRARGLRALGALGEATGEDALAAVSYEEARALFHQIGLAEEPGALTEVDEPVSQPAV